MLTVCVSLRNYDFNLSPSCLSVSLSLSASSRDFIYATSVSVIQDSLGELAMDDYWKEVENISCSGGGDGGGAGRGESGTEVQEDDKLKVPEGTGKRKCKGVLFRLCDVSQPR